MKTIYGHNAVPHLFDTVDGIAPQLASYIATQERIARHERGDHDAGRITTASKFNARGVGKICSDLLAEIDERQTPKKGSKGLPRDGGQYCKSWCYALHIYCANHQQRATPELLCLTFRVLNCTELSPDAEMRADIGVFEKSRNRALFLEAIDADGEHWARHGRQCPDEDLGARVGVTGRLIRDRWRKEPEYRRRVRFAVGNWLSALERAGEPTAREKIDFKTLAKKDAEAQRAEAQARHEAQKSRG